MTNELPPAIPTISFAEKSETPIQTLGSASSRSIDAVTLDASQIDQCFHLYVLNERAGNSGDLLILPDFLGDITHTSHFSTQTSHPKTIMADLLSFFG
jgi:hypothetical protein